MARQQIGHLRHETHRAARGTMPAGFATLRDDDRRPRRHGHAHMLDRLALADERHAGGRDLGRERPRITKGQHHRARLMCERLRQQLRLFRHGPGDETAADARIAGGPEFGFKPIGIAIAAADEPQPATARHGRRERAASSHRHRRRQDRMRQPEALCQPGRRHGSDQLAGGEIHIDLARTS
jgi:hypothetical protein